MSIEVEVTLLAESVDRLHAQVVVLEREVKALTAMRNTGKGVFYGLLIAASSMGAGASTLINKIFGD